MLTLMSYEGDARSEVSGMVGRRPLTTEEQEVARLLRQAQRAQGYTYASLASATDIPKGTIQGILEGTSRTTLLRYAQLARVLGISLDALLPSERPSPREEIARLLPALDEAMIQSIYAFVHTYASHRGLLSHPC